MLISVVYFYQVLPGVEFSTIIIRNNFGQIEILENFSNKTSLDQELSSIKNRLQTTGLYKNGIFYPKVGELVYSVSGVPKRKKILIDNEYLRS